MTSGESGYPLDRRVLFGQAAAAYDAARPGYPARVFEILEEGAGLGPGTDVVEVGPGTGQATAELLERGATVRAIELSDELAGRLQARCRGRRLSVTVGAFEEVELDPSSTDLVASATAFHWVPTRAGLSAAAGVLRSSGHLALWWNHYGDPSRPDPFQRALTRLLRQLAPELVDPDGTGRGGVGRHPYALDAPARIAEIEAHGRFGPVYHEVIPWTGRHTAAGLRGLFSTFSPWLALAEEHRRRVLDALEELAVKEFGGIVERPYLTPIYVAPKRR